jgi:hypothetical protein
VEMVFLVALLSLHTLQHNPSRCAVKASKYVYQLLLGRDFIDILSLCACQEWCWWRLRYSFIKTLTCRSAETKSAYFPHFEETKVRLWERLAVCVCITPCMLCNGSVNTFPRQRLHTQQQNNCWTHRFQRGPFRMKGT